MKFVRIYKLLANAICLFYKGKGKIMSEIRESGEDYLEAMLQLENEYKEIRSVDVANRMNVSRPSVNKAVTVLKEAGMVSQEPYGNIHLTEEGRSRAKAVYKRHATLQKFLADVLNVEPDIAEKDACRMEHIISEETFQSIRKMLKEFEEAGKIK